jgi:hypothetical protein
MLLNFGNLSLARYWVPTFDINATSTHAKRCENPTIVRRCHEIDGAYLDIFSLCLVVWKLWRIYELLAHLRRFSEPWCLWFEEHLKTLRSRDYDWSHLSEGTLTLFGYAKLATFIGFDPCIRSVPDVREDYEYNNSARPRGHIVLQRGFYDWFLGRWPWQSVTGTFTWLAIIEKKPLLL